MRHPLYLLKAEFSPAKENKRHFKSIPFGLNLLKHDHNEAYAIEIVLSFKVLHFMNHSLNSYAIVLYSG